MKGAVLVACVGLLAVGVWVAPDLSHFERYVMADQRTIAGVPNGMDVLSNVLFLFVGIAGFAATTDGHVSFHDRWTRWPYRALFAGVVLTAFGSTWFHLAPSPARVVWDRLPMTIAFMGLLTAVIAERVSVGAARVVFGPLLLVGIGTVVYWRATQLTGAADLRPYALVQVGSLAIVTLVLTLYRGQERGGEWLWTGLVLYGIAKIFEMADGPIYHVLGVVSGHTLKHITAAAAVACIVAMLRWRSRPSASGMLSSGQQNAQPIVP